MILFKRIKIRSYEKGLVFRDGEFKEILGEGRKWVFDPFNKLKVEVVSQRDPWLLHERLDLILRSGALKNDAVTLDLKDDERGLVWIDGRFATLIGEGIYALWTKFRKVKVEVVSVKDVLFEHKDFNAITSSDGASLLLNVFTVEEGHVSLLYVDGDLKKVLQPGVYATWKKAGKVRVLTMDLREKTLDVSGQELMTADKVSLRVNAVVTWKVDDPRKAVEEVQDADQALYRDAQLALRGIIGTRDLDVLLTEKNEVAAELENAMRKRAATFGARIISLGIRDIILPGDMKMLLNKVIEAKKASEANVILRREETAAIRSQLNTAKLMEGNPALMKLKEMEVLEKVAASSNLQVILGEQGLAERVMKLL